MIQEVPLLSPFVNGFRIRRFANFHISHNYFPLLDNAPPRFRFTFFVVQDSYLGFQNNVTIIKTHNHENALNFPSGPRNFLHNICGSK